jgi:hypothetical protein
MISPIDIVGINELSLILKIIGQCEVKHIYDVTKKKSSSTLKTAGILTVYRN